MRWFELYKDRYEQELRELSEVGITFRIDDEIFAEGVLRLYLTIPRENVHFDVPDSGRSLVVVFPDSYPWFRPEVYAYELHLHRHQHLLTKNLCLLPRGTQHWDPTETVASLLLDQLKLVLEKGLETDEEVIQADSAETAEPISEYYVFQQEGHMIFDASQIHLDIPISFRAIGTMKVGLPESFSLPSRMAVLETYLPSIGTRHTLSHEVSKMFSHKTLQGIMYEAPEPPPLLSEDRNSQVVRWLKTGLTAAKESFSVPVSNIKCRGGNFKSVIGIRFPQEVKPGIKGGAWLFLVQVEVPAINTGKVGLKLREGYYWSRPVYLGREAASDRIPRLAPLATKSVAVVGLGALGSFIAVELARAGIGELKMLDFDIVDAPTTVRWPLGVSAAGVLKTKALKEFILQNYPDTKVTVISHRFGHARVDGLEKKLQPSLADDEVIAELFRGTDLFVDATAEPGINHFLSRYGVRSNLPHVIAYATPGALGGVVMRWRPRAEIGCWNCLKYHQDSDQVLVPPVEDNGLIQPPGCADETFTGSSFDLQQISHASVRAIVSTLCSGTESGYADLPWDWAVLKLIDEQGSPIPPTWIAQLLNIHHKCGYCAKK